VGHALVRLGDFRFGYAQRPDLLQPDPGVAGLYLGIMAKDLLGVDEQATFGQGAPNATKEVLFRGVFQMMDRQCRDDEIPRTAELGIGHVGYGIGNGRISIEALPGLLEHFFRGIDEVDLRIGVAGKQHGAEKTGASAKIQDTQFIGVPPVIDQVECCAVKRIETGNKAAPKDVVAGRISIEDG